MADDGYIWCDCGDGYKMDSYGAGFLDALGRCENCQAAQDSSVALEDQAVAGPTSEHWQELAAAMYQAAAKFNMPLRFLDILTTAANGEAFAHQLEGLLPVSEDEAGVWDIED